MSLESLPNRAEPSSLELLGWNDTWQEAFDLRKGEGLSPGRVAREELARFTILDETGERPAENSGRLRHEAGAASELPAVGDWVVVRRSVDGPSMIVSVLPRQTAFIRKTAGETTEEQVIAANVDTVFLVSGLDGDLNVRRIERYLTAAWESGAAPVIVLNKADLAEDLDSQVAEVETIAYGVPVVTISALAGRERDGEAGRTSPVEALSPWLVSGGTIALLGSSGVGKSTLANALLGSDRQDTGSVRQDDSRGRHTTTRRELIVLPSGALLIDTPGMRELQLWGDETRLDGTFPDVTKLAESCRFTDCAHRTEPGCAILEALESGALESERFAAWSKLQKELAHLERRRDARAMADERNRWKKITRSYRQWTKSRRSD